MVTSHKISHTWSIGTSIYFALWSDRLHVSTYLESGWTVDGSYHPLNDEPRHQNRKVMCDDKDLQIAVCETSDRPDLDDTFGMVNREKRSECIESLSRN